MKRYETFPDVTLERIVADDHSPEAAKRRAREELSRRSRIVDHCPRGRACGAWGCEKVH